MNKIVFVALLGMFAVNVAYGDANCDAKAADKKLAGAAKNSFVKKCNKDAAIAACATQASEKMLKGAAKNSFLKKCEKDAAAS